MSLENEVKSDPEMFRPHIEYFGHKETFDQLTAFFPGLKPEDMPDGEGWALERINLTTHNGTHLDAPFHFHSTMDGGKRALTIDEIDLDWCFQPGVKLDFRHLPDGTVAKAKDVETELRRIGHELKPLKSSWLIRARVSAPARTIMLVRDAEWDVRRLCFSLSGACG